VSLSNDVTSLQILMDGNFNRQQNMTPKAENRKKEKLF